jgi:hypothetical protein
LLTASKYYVIVCVLLINVSNTKKYRSSFFYRIPSLIFAPVHFDTREYNIKKLRHPFSVREVRSNQSGHSSWARLNSIYIYKTITNYCETSCIESRLYYYLENSYIIQFLSNRGTVILRPLKRILLLGLGLYAEVIRSGHPRSSYSG